MFFASTNGAFFQQAFDFADFVKGLPPDQGIADFIPGTKPLQCPFADFQKSAHFVAVHPNVFRLFLSFALQSGNEFGNRIDLRL
jgi:hypothetical protein